MTVPKILYVAIALLCSSSMLPVVYVNGQEQESATSTTTCTSITDIVCDEEYSNEYNLKAICEAISISELDDDLNEESWTLFAPNDNAFESLGRNNLDYLVFNATIDSVPLTDLLLFHIIPGVGLTSAELPCVAGNNLIEMANGEDSRTLCTMKTIPFSQKGQYNSKITPPLIIKANIQACNGIIHILDQVMLDIELPYPIPDLTATTDTDIDTDIDIDIDINRAADVVDDDDDDDIVSVIDIETTEEPVPVATTEEPTEPPTFLPGNTTDTDEDDTECKSIAEIACSSRTFTMLCSLLEENALLDDLDDGLWTVFAPANDAFNKAPPIPEDITNVLLGHTISNELIMFDELICTEKTEMTNGKDTRTVCGSGSNGGTKYQNGRGNDDNQRPEITDNNIIACNGIIHIVSEVILP